MKTVLLLTPDITDTSSTKRGEALIAQGCRLLMVGFRRERYNQDYRPTWPYLLLGRTEDGRYGQRLRTLLRALTVLAANRGMLKQADVIYARNIDQMILALFIRVLVGRHIPTVYEVLDIQPVFVGRSRLSRAIRAAERYALKHISLLVLSSPAFLRHYFAGMQGYRRSWFLLENKLPASVTRNKAALSGRNRAERRNGYRWVVAYCGLIRGQDTFDLIVRLAERLQGVVQFRFHGVLTTVDRRRFEEAVARLDNLVYEGPYVNPRDLAKIYAGVDFAWALDLENVEHNSRWLLPCRFYEAGFFGVPCLAARGFEVGALVEDLGVGWSFEPSYEESLVRFLSFLSEEEYARRRRRLLEMPASRFVGGEDMVALLQALDATDGPAGDAVAAGAMHRPANDEVPATRAAADAGDESGYRPAIP